MIYFLNTLIFLSPPLLAFSFFSVQVRVCQGTGASPIFVDLMIAVRIGLSVPSRRRNDLLIHHERMLKCARVMCWVALDFEFFFFQKGTSYLICNVGFGEAHRGDEPLLFNF